VTSRPHVVHKPNHEIKSETCCAAHAQVDAETNGVVLMTCHQRRELPPITEEEEEGGEERREKSAAASTAEKTEKTSPPSAATPGSASAGVNKAPGSARPNSVCNC